MPYTPQTWSDLPSQTTPINAARLSYLETQYDQVAADIDDTGTPVGAAVAAALTPKADAANPVFTGTVTVPDGALAIADTSGLQTALDTKAPLASPALTGDPTAPTPATADNDTSIATTAFVKAQGYAPLASPALTGNPTAPTPTAGDSDTSIATTGFVVSATAHVAAGTLVAFFGDSKPGGIDAAIGSYPDFYAMVSNQQAMMESVLSYGGYRSDQLLAVVADVTALASSDVRVVVNDIGTNDASASVPVATYAANMMAIIAAERAVGQLPVLMTQPPLSPSGVVKTLIIGYNQWLRRFAQHQRLPLVDVYPSTVTVSNGQMLAAYDNGDGVHMNGNGNLAVANLLKTALTNVLPPAPTGLVQFSPGAPNMLSNSTFLNDANTDGVPDGWNKGTGAGFTASLVSDARGFNWQRITLSGATGSLREVYATQVTTGFAAGDRLAIAALVRSGQTGSGKNLRPKVTFSDGAFSPLLNQTLTTPRTGGTGSILQLEGTVYKEVVVPTGTVNIVASLAAGIGDGTYDWALPTIINLTSLGIA